MAEFKFKLQSIQDLRERQLQECQRHLQDLRLKKQKLQEMLAEQKNGYFDDREALNRNKERGEFHQIKLYEDSLDLRKNRMLSILEAMRELDFDIDIAEQALISAERDKKIITKLKEKKFQEFVKTEDQKESKLLDEKVTLQFGRDSFLQQQKKGNDL